MSDVFLSYSRENQPTARLFAEALQRAGLSVWWDETLSAGEAYDEVTERALEGARAVVVLWSKASVASRWVRAEATTADRNGTLVPVMIEACKRPIMFELRQTADLSHWKGDTTDPAWQRFIGGLLDLVPGGATPSSLPAKSATRPQSRGFSAAAIAVIAICLLLAGAGTFWYLNRAKSVGSEAAPTADVEASIAVLPLRDMSPAKDQGYFVDGITEEILDSLARIPDLKVTARTSSFAFKDKDVNLQEVGKTLGVANILEGSLRKDGDQLKITLQLIDAKTDAHRWSKTYDRPFRDVFAIQEDIAHSVAEALQVSLGVGAARRPGMTRNVEAFEAFASAIPVVERVQGSPQEVRMAINQVQRAIALDPEFLGAYGVLFALYQVAPLLITDEPAQAWRGRSDALIAEIQRRFPDSLELRDALARRASDLGRWGDAMEEYQRAAVEARKQGALWQTYPPPPFLVVIGRFREAINALEATRDRDPLNQTVASQLAEAYASNGDIAAAMAEFDRGLQLEGTDTPRLKGTAFLTAMASRDRAEIGRRFDALQTGNTPDAAMNRVLYALIDKPAEGLAELKRRVDDKSLAPLSRLRLAYWRAYFGDAQGALDLLQAEYRRSPSTTIIPTAMWRPVMRNVRQLPGSRQLMRDLGLVDFWRKTVWPDLCKPVGEDDFECQ